MKQIWKFTVEVGENEIHMPCGAQVLTVQMQGDAPMLWALVETSSKSTKRFFHVYGTEHPLPIDLDVSEYIDTFQMRGGRLVWHLFERGGQ